MPANQKEILHVSLFRDYTFECMFFQFVTYMHIQYKFEVIFLKNNSLSLSDIFLFLSLDSQVFSCTCKFNLYITVFSL